LLFINNKIDRIYYIKIQAQYQQKQLIDLLYNFNKLFSIKARIGSN